MTTINVEEPAGGPWVVSVPLPRMETGNLRFAYLMTTFADDTTFFTFAPTKAKIFTCHAEAERWAATLTARSSYGSKWSAEPAGHILY